MRFDAARLAQWVRIAADAERLNLRLMRRRPRRAVVFGVQSTTFLQFVEDVANAWAEAFPRDILVFAHVEHTEAYMRRHQPALHARSHHIRMEALLWSVFREADLFVTSSHGQDVAIPTAYITHGQPSKRISFTRRGLEAMDAFLLIGPLQLRALVEWLDEEHVVLPPTLRLVPNGYAKSDAVVGGRFDAQAIAREWGLDPAKKTVLYAPAFNEGGSLREFGVELVETLVEEQGWNVLAKLPEDVFEPDAPEEQTGGRDWRATFRQLEENHANLHLVRDYRVDRALAVADVLVTCVSGVGFEMLALGKPVVFVDAPRFYEVVLKRMFPDRPTETWRHRTTINGGREFGTVVDHYRELPDVLRRVLANPSAFVRPKEELQDELLYHPGRGTESTLENLDAMLRHGRRGRRRRQQPLPTRLRNALKILRS